jgi:hypothetical protein
MAITEQQQTTLLARLADLQLRLQNDLVNAPDRALRGRYLLELRDVEVCIDAAMELETIPDTAITAAVGPQAAIHVDAVAVDRNRADPAGARGWKLELAGGIVALRCVPAAGGTWRVEQKERGAPHWRDVGAAASPIDGIRKLMRGGMLAGLFNIVFHPRRIG